MDDDTPGFGVDFVIDAGESFGELARLAATMESTEAKILADAKRIETATGGMINVAGASAEIKTFGAAATRELASAAREIRAAEKAGEAMVRQLEKQNAAFGKTREELRAMRAEERALAAERTGNTDLAKRIRAQEQALFDQEFASARRARFEAEALAQDQAEAALKAAAAHAQEARVVREAAHAHALFEARVREGVAAMKAADAVARQTALEQHAQEVRSASLAHAMFEARVREGARAMKEAEAAAERDAAAVAQLRALIDPAAAAQSRLNAEIAEARRVMTAAGASAEELARAEDALIARSAGAVRQHDAMAVAAGRNGFALQQMAIQMPDIVQGLLTGQKPMTVFIQQGGQLVQIAMMAEGGLRGFGKELALGALRFAPFLVGIAAAGAGFALFNRWVNQGVTNDQLTRDLGEITGGADATKQELFKLKDETITWADTSKALFSEVGKDVSAVFVSDMKAMGKDVKDVLDDLTSYGRMALSGLYAGVAGTRAYLGEIEKGGVVGLAKMAIGQGDPQLLEKTYGAAYNAADEYLTKLGARVKAAALENARTRIAESIGFNTPPKPKVDHHGEQLERQARAMEAQIAGLYRVAEAYDVSGAAALIAEARVKAETDAINKRGEVEAFFDRQLRLSIAERVKTASQGAASMRDEAAVQAEVNQLIADGLAPAERANDLVRERLADLPLLAAIEVAQQRGLTIEVEKATAALKAQRDARVIAAAPEVGRFVFTASQQADRQLEIQREELRLVGATDMARVRAMATLQAEQAWRAKGWALGTTHANDYVAKQVEVAVGAEKNRQAQDAWNASLGYTAELFDEIDRSAQQAAASMADAFGDVGRTIGDVATIMSGYYADQASLQQAHDAAIRKAGENQAAIAHEQQLFAMRSSSLQVGAYGDMAVAAKSFFKEGSRGYQAMAAAEKIYRVAQMAMSLSAMVQNTLETTTSVANAGARAAAEGTAGIAAQAKLPFPVNLAAMAATGAALIAAGVAVAGGFGGGTNNLPKSNTGTGTVLGNGEAQSESLKRSIDALRDVDTLMLGTSRDMAATLRSIDSQIGGVAALVVRQGNVNADAGVTEGFKTNAVGGFLKATLPVVGGLLSSLFGSKTSVIASGLSAGPQSLGSILNGGFDASYYSDIEKKKKFLGITTGTSYSTQYSAADAGLEQQFTLILRDFNTAIAAAAAPLGEATGTIEQRLAGFVVDLGKIDLKGLTGTEIEEKLSAVFGAAADRMAAGAFPGIERFQKVGEGVFETLVRVSSTVEATTATLAQLGLTSRALGIDAKMGIAAQFESVSAMTSAAQSYFEAFYSKEEQSAARTAELRQVFVDLGMVMPSTLAGFRQLVEAQDLTTAAGQKAYATLIQLAPAFADLQTSLEGAKSAADILSERRDLQRRILELNGDTAALRALDLAKVDASNRALQEQIYAIEDAQAAAKAADELRQAWTSVGDSIMDEVRRIRGLTTAGGGGTFAELLGRFNAANAAARGGDMDAAKGLPALSQALLTAAADAATSRQELARVQAATAAQLEATYGVIGALTAPKPTSTTTQITAAAAAQGTPTQDTSVDDAADRRALLEEVAGMRRDLNAGLATIAGATTRTDRRLEQVTAASGGTAISTEAA